MRDLPLISLFFRGWFTFQYELPYRALYCGGLTYAFGICNVCGLVEASQLTRMHKRARGDYGKDIYHHEHPLTFLILTRTNNGRRSFFIAGDSPTPLIEWVLRRLGKGWAVEYYNVDEIESELRDYFPPFSPLTFLFRGEMTKIVVLEIGRPILEDVKRQLGEVYAVISYPRAVSEVEYAEIIKNVISKIREAGDEVHLVLSGPLALAFQLGQVVGLSHWRIVVYQFSGGRYVPAPPITRDALF